MYPSTYPNDCVVLGRLQQLLPKASVHILHYLLSLETTCWYIPFLDSFVFHFDQWFSDGKHHCFQKWFVNIWTCYQCFRKWFGIIIPSLHNLYSNMLTLFRMGQEKRFYASLSPVIPTNIGISPQNFLTFNFNLFVTLM